MQTRIELAQLNLTVGAVAANCQKVIECMQNSTADIIVFPEMTLTSYPIEDLVFRAALYAEITDALEQIRLQTQNGPAVLVGAPWHEDGHYFNKAFFIAAGDILADYDKQILPNYAVFDEKRYFTAGNRSCVVAYHGLNLGIAICEDVWHDGPCQHLKAAGADLVLSLNASPYHRYKNLVRSEQLSRLAKSTELPIVYCNLVGGQDELVFDGGSSVYDQHGKVILQANFFCEDHAILTVTKNGALSLSADRILTAPDELAAIYQALTLGVRDYLHKNHFKKAILGLSGGIDSALTLAIAVDAIGADNVTAYLMPSDYTADISNEDAAEQAVKQKVAHHELPIKQTFTAFIDTLKPLGAELSGLTLENLQPRCRGTLLMAISNNTGAIVLTTGNKSELAVGYSTLYGDMAGGFNALKDVPKTLVYALAKYRNSLEHVIPERVITRAPSAELAPGQVDQDSLPPYEVLDQIIHLSMDKDWSTEQIREAANIDVDTIRKVKHMIKINEYKRRQAPVGIRITPRGFGKDRRYPITSGYGD